LEQFSKHLARAFLLYSVSGVGCPFSRLIEASERGCPSFQKCRIQGLATLCAVSAIRNLGGIFQPPTLLRFALQSFNPLTQSKKFFRISLPSLRFSVKPNWPHCGAPTI
jgi:hypothetical protein